MIRNTVQRQIIQEALKKNNTHPTVKEICIEIYKDHPTISKATVYRNLSKLAENSKIRKLLLPEEPERYDDRIEQHYHFKCKNCGSIFDVDIEYLAGINAAVQGKYGVQVDDHDVVFSGVCQKCNNWRRINGLQNTSDRV